MWFLKLAQVPGVQSGRMWRPARHDLAADAIVKVDARTAGGCAVARLGVQDPSSSHRAQLKLVAPWMSTMEYVTR